MNLHHSLSPAATTKKSRSKSRPTFPSFMAGLESMETPHALVPFIGCGVEEQKEEEEDVVEEEEEDDVIFSPFEWGDGICG